MSFPLEPDPLNQTGLKPVTFLALRGVSRAKRQGTDWEWRLFVREEIRNSWALEGTLPPLAKPTP